MKIDWIGEGGDLVVSILGKYARWLNVRARRVCFLLWIVCCCYWIYRDIKCNLYVQAWFNLLSIFLHYYGWKYWKKKELEKKNKGRIMYLAVIEYTLTTYGANVNKYDKYILCKSYEEVKKKIQEVEQLNSFTVYRVDDDPVCSYDIKKAIKKALFREED